MINQQKLLERMKPQMKRGRYKEVGMRWDVDLLKGQRVVGD